MQKITRCSIDNITEEPCIIVGEASDALLKLQNEGHLVLCELKELQGLSEGEVERILKEDSRLWQYKNVCMDAKALPEAYLHRLWYRHKGLPVVIAETERLLIRESVAEDAKAFEELYADPDVQEFLEQPPIEQGWEEYIIQYAQNQYGFYEYGMWSVIEKDSGAVIGRMGLELQRLSKGHDAGEEKLALGYALRPQYRQKGFALEACLAILDYCKECDYTTEIYVKIDEKNTKSSNLLQKLCEHNKIILKRM